VYDLSALVIPSPYYEAERGGDFGRAAIVRENSSPPRNSKKSKRAITAFFS
jgi:hypothetical protein